MRPTEEDFPDKEEDFRPASPGLVSTILLSVHSRGGFVDAV
jgi:hypothetical protein